MAQLRAADACAAETGEPDGTDVLQRPARDAVARTFSAGMAHEVNNPLAVVMANTSFAVAQLGDLITRLQVAPIGRDELRHQLAEAIAALHESQESADRIRRLVVDLRAIAASRLRRREPLDLREVVAVAADAAGLPGPAEGPALPIAGDPDLLARVFFALLRNARQATAREGRVSITCGVDGSSAWVAIEDDGEGVRAEHRAQVFDPFFTTRAPGQGVGLGLSLARAGVLAHGGELGLDSRRGEGTRVRVSLPLAHER